jgi:hypothetical protein
MGLLEAPVNLLEAPVNLLEAFVNLLEAFVNLLEAFVNLLEAFVNLLEAFVDVVEAIVDPVEPPFESVVGPTLRHSLHDGTVTSCLRHVARRTSSFRNVSCTQRAAEGASAYARLGRIWRSLFTRSSIGGWVEKSPARPLAEKGLTM